MSTARAVAVIMTAVLLAPTALASDLTARTLLFSGSTTLEGDAAALFFLLQSDDAGIDWTITAAGGTIERDYFVELAADNPANPTAYLVDYETDSGHETMDLQDAVLTSTGGQEQGAFLARGDLLTTATSAGLVGVRSVMDPVVSQFGEREIGGGENYGIEETIPGDYLEVGFSDGTLTLRGDLIIDLFGPSYALENDGETVEYQTGEVETQRYGGVAEVRVETHTLQLQDAVVHVRARDPITVFTRFPTIDVVGTLEATGAEGAVGGEELGSDGGGWVGTTRLTLSSADGLVSAASPGENAIGTAAIIAQPKLPLTFAAILGLLALAAVAFVLLGRRKREDDLELALLAMEERRWQDALPRLQRLAKKDPHNASVQIDRALCLEQVGRFEEAAKAFEAALRAAPRHAEAHFYYARTLAKMQEKEAARVHLEAALERDPRLAEMMRAETVLKGL